MAELPLHDSPHALDALLAGAALALGVTGLLLVVLDLNAAAMWTGVAGVLLGGWGQMESRNTPERFADVVGIVAAGVAFMVGASQAGLG